MKTLDWLLPWRAKRLLDKINPIAYEAQKENEQLAKRIVVLNMEKDEVLEKLKDCENECAKMTRLYEMSLEKLNDEQCRSEALRSSIAQSKKDVEKASSTIKDSQKLEEQVKSMQVELDKERRKVMALGKWVMTVHRLDSVVQDGTIKRMLQGTPLPALILSLFMCFGCLAQPLPPILRNYFTTNQNPSVTVTGVSLNFGGSITVTGSVTASNYYGNGFSITNLNLNNITNGYLISNFVAVVGGTNVAVDVTNTATKTYYVVSTPGYGGTQLTNWALLSTNDYALWVSNSVYTSSSNLMSLSTNTLYAATTNAINLAASNRVVVIAGTNSTVVTNSPAANVMGYTVSSVAYGNLTNWVSLGTNDYALWVSNQSYVGFANNSTNFLRLVDTNTFAQSISNNAYTGASNFTVVAASNRVVVIAGTNATVVTNSPVAGIMAYTVSSTAIGGSSTNVVVLIPGVNTTVTTNTPVPGTTSYAINASAGGIASNAIANEYGIGTNITIRGDTNGIIPVLTLGHNPNDLDNAPYISLTNASGVEIGGVASDGSLWGSLLQGLLTVVDIVNVATNGITSTNEYTKNILGQSYASSQSRLPMMGFTSWGIHSSDNSETNARSDMNTLRDYFLPFGYNHYLLSDGWNKTNLDANHLLQPSEGFPTGLTNLVQYAHTNGLKIGVFAGCGHIATATNIWSEGKNVAGCYGYWEINAQFLLSLGFDQFVNVVDDYAFDTPAAREINYYKYRRFLSGLQSMSKPFRYQATVWSMQPWMEGNLNGNYLQFYRFDGTGTNQIGDPNGTLGQSLEFLDYWGKTNYWWTHPGQMFDGGWMPGGWTSESDAALRNPEDSVDRTIMTIHCLMSWDMVVQTFGIASRNARYTNIFAVSINQDPLVIPATLVYSNSNVEVYRKPLKRLGSENWALGFIDRSTNNAWTNAAWVIKTTNTITPTWAQLGIKDGPYMITDVWGSSNNVATRFNNTTNALTVTTTNYQSQLYILEPYLTGDGSLITGIDTLTKQQSTNLVNQFGVNATNNDLLIGLNSTNYANSLGTFSQNWYVWGSSNSPGATNAAGNPYKVMQRSDVPMTPTANTNTYTSPTDGSYIGEVISAIPAGVIEYKQGTMIRAFYAFTSGSTLKLTPEVYIRTNLYAASISDPGEREIAVGTAQIITTTPTAYMMSITLGTNVSCSATNYLVVKFKVTDRVGTPNVSLVSQGTFNAYLSVPLQSANFVMRAGDTMTGNLVQNGGQFIGNGLGLTNLNASNLSTGLVNQSRLGTNFESGTSVIFLDATNQYYVALMGFITNTVGGGTFAPHRNNVIFNESYISYADSPTFNATQITIDESKIAGIAASNVISGGTVSPSAMGRFTNHSDVTIASLAVGDMMKWSGTEWTNGTAVAGNGYYPTNALVLMYGVTNPAFTSGLRLVPDLGMQVTTNSGDLKISVQGYLTNWWGINPGIMATVEDAYNAAEWRTTSNNVFTASNLFTGVTVFSNDVTINGTLTVNSTNATTTASNLSVGGWISALTYSNLPPRTLGITIDAGGTNISSGTKGFVEVPYGCTIQSASLLADQVGSIAIATWRTNSGNLTLLSAAGSLFTNVLTATNWSRDATLAGATSKSIAANDILGFQVLTNASAITRVTLQLKVQQ